MPHDPAHDMGVMPPSAEPSDSPADDLTGALTRRAFVSEAERALASGPASLLVVDVDRFKQVNDSYGHQQGDDVLRAVAAALRAELSGAGAVVGRYGGDEFVVLLRGADPETALGAAARVRARLAADPIPLRGRTGVLGVTLSIGVASSPIHGATLEELFAASDRALYGVKRAGRDGAAVADSGEKAPRAELNFGRFSGREAERRSLVEALDAAVAGRASAVAVVGEAGVGKTTLVAQLAPEVRARGGELVRGRCYEADVRPPYGAWAEVLRATVALGVIPARPWQELPRLVPELGEGAARGGGEVGNKYTLLHEITELLRIAAAARPLVIVLDDMQWADAASWDTLEYLLPQLDGERLLICLTVRAEEHNGPLHERLRRSAGDARLRTHRLGRLPRVQLEEWAEGVLGQTLPRELHGLIYQHSEGNPLLAVHILRTLLDEGALWHTGERWEWKPPAALRLPAAVSDLLARRLEGLSADARRVLVTAAVMGRTFDVDVLEAAGVGDAASLRAVVDEGIRAAVLQATSTALSFEFTHGLLVNAARHDASPRRVRNAHRSIAGSLERLRPTQVAAIATHYDQAGEAAKAYAFALRAGEEATAVYAHDDAIRFFSIAERHADGPGALAAARLRLADASEAAGHYASAEALCDLLLGGMSEDGGLPARTLPIRRMRERLRALQDEPPRRTLAACETLLAEADAAGLAEERVQLLAMISRAHSRLAEWEAAREVASRCVELARTLDDPRLLGGALARLGMAHLEREPLETLRLAAEALVEYRRVGDRLGEIRCHIDLGNAHLRLALVPSAAEDEFRLALEQARDAHAPELAGLALLNLGVIEMRAGRYDGARTSYEEVLRLATSVRNGLQRLVSLYNLAHLAREQGDAAGALQPYRACAELAREIGQHDIELGALAGAGLSALAAGNRLDAEQFLRESETSVRVRGDSWFQGRELVEALAVLLALAGGDVIGTERRLRDAVALIEQRDSYAAAVLVVECAGALLDAGVYSVSGHVERLAAVAEASGLEPLQARYRTLLARLPRSPDAIAARDSRSA